MMNIEESEYNLSFAGCGFLGLYHAGVCSCIQKFAPHLYKNQKICGASAGAIAATFLVCDIKISDFVNYFMQTINTTRSYFLGPFDPRFKITQYLREGLELYLPEDAHIRCSGYLHISMTNQDTQENYITKNYKDRNELIKAVLCSSYIPVFSGFIPLTFRGEWMVDGALTKNMLELNCSTITISPFSGDADICPRDDWGCGQIYIAGTSFLVNSNNVSRIINMFWPKSPEELGKLAQLGHDDALQFLSTKGFINCDFHRSQQIFTKVKMTCKQRMATENCKKCRHNLKKALRSALSNKTLFSFTSTATVEKHIMKYFRFLYKAATLQISISIIFNIIRRFSASLINVVRTIISLDEIFKKMLSKITECNDNHYCFNDNYSAYELNNRNESQTSLDRTTLNNSESECLLFDEVDSSNIKKPSINNESFEHEELGRYFYLPDNEKEVEDTLIRESDDKNPYNSKEKEIMDELINSS